MSTTGWIIVGLAIVIVAVVGLVAASRVASSRRRTHLQDRFGPEYDRAVGEAGSRSVAEDELADRERRHSELELNHCPRPAARGISKSGRACNSGSSTIPRTLRHRRSNSFTA